MQRINVDQESAGQDEVETATSPTSEKFFRFLDLPPEIRNIVYSYSTVYRAEADCLRRVGKCLPNLRQPPITRVNRQIRSECLAIFYEMHHFSLNLNVRFEKLAEGGYKIIPAAEGQASLQSFHEMIQAFAPSPKNTLQMSNLRFLPSLTVKIKVIRRDMGLGCLGFRMSSADKTTIASLAVRGLDWNCNGSVDWAWIEAAEKSVLRNEGGNFWEWDEMCLRHNRDLLDEMTDLLCLVARHCPQLTRSVSIIYKEAGWDGSDGGLFDLVEEAILEKLREERQED